MRARIVWRIEFAFGSGDEDEKALIGGGDVEPQTEIWKIGDRRFGGRGLGWVVFGNGGERFSEIGSEDLTGSTMAPRKAFLAIW